MNYNMPSETPKLTPILKKQGQIILEDVPDLVLCKPRLIPLKSFSLEKLEKMQAEINKGNSRSSQNQCE